MVGDLAQIPPMYSAIKVKGERLYKAARRGETVERKERAVTINTFEVIRDETDRQLVHFRVDCSKGTYVRTLAYDLVGATRLDKPSRNRSTQTLINRLFYVASKTD